MNIAYGLYVLAEPTAIFTNQKFGGLFQGTFHGTFKSTYFTHHGQ